MLKLIVESGFPKGADFTLRDGETILGRSSECGIHLKAMDVSRRHLELLVQGNRVTVKNLSSHGSKLDGRPLTEPTELKDGQRLTLGMATVLLFTSVPDDGDFNAQEVLATAQAEATTLAEPVAPPEEERKELSPPAPSEIDVSEPVSRESVSLDFVAPRAAESLPKLDVIAQPGRSDEAYDFATRDSLHVADRIDRDTKFEPSDDSFDARPEAWSPEIPQADEGGHTQAMNPEAVRFLREIQKKRARRRTTLLIVVAVLALVAITILIALI